MPKSKEIIRLRPGCSKSIKLCTLCSICIVLRRIKEISTGENKEISFSGQEKNLCRTDRSYKRSRGKYLKIK